MSAMATPSRSGMKKERRKVMRMWMTVSSVVLLAIAADAQAQVARDTTSAPTGEGAAPATPAGTMAAEARKDYTQIRLEELLNKHITVSATKARGSLKCATCLPVAATIAVAVSRPMLGIDNKVVHAGHWRAP